MSHNSYFKKCKVRTDEWKSRSRQIFGRIPSKIRQNRLVTDTIPYFFHLFSHEGLLPRRLHTTVDTLGRIMTTHIQRVAPHTYIHTCNKAFHKVILVNAYLEVALLLVSVSFAPVPIKIA